VRITSIKTAKITPGMTDIQGLLDQAFQDVQEKEVLAIASKVVSLCGNNVVPLDGAAKDEPLFRNPMPTRLTS
jgi:F420-0:gamma-glutamyl ligase